MKKITFLLLFVSVLVNAQETEIYNTLEEFQQSIEDNCANTELTYEDFDGILETNCAVPIIPDMNQECFAINELEEGFTVQGDGGETIIAGMEGQFGDSPINFVVPNSTVSTTIINFDPPVNAVAFSLWGFFNDTGSTQVTLFNDNNEVIDIIDLDTPTDELFFFSVISTSTISRVETFNPDEPPDPDNNPFGGSGGNLIGQLYFGAMDCTTLSTNNQILNNISIAPNPASNFVDIYIPQNITIEHITLKSVSGQNIDLNLNNNRVDISALVSGIYFMTIKSDLGAITKKLIIN